MLRQTCLCYLMLLFLMPLSSCENLEGDGAGNQGKMTIPLTGTSNTGATYRLVDGQFAINGPGGDTSFSSNDYLGQTSADIELVEGSYSIALLDGWVLEREENGVFTPVADVVLTSPNPAIAVIEPDTVTSVVFLFTVDDEIIGLTGTLSVSISVDDDTDSTITIGSIADTQLTVSRTLEIPVSAAGTTGISFCIAQGPSWASVETLSNSGTNASGVIILDPVGNYSGEYNVSVIATSDTCNDAQNYAETTFSVEVFAPYLFTTEVGAYRNGGYEMNTTEFNGDIYFQGYSPEFGTELWATDGTAEGTRLLTDIVPSTGMSSPANFIVLDDLFYFTATDGDGDRGLWRTDGTAAGVERVLSDSGRVYQPIRLGNTIVYNGYYVGEGTELYAWSPVIENPVQLTSNPSSDNGSNPALHTVVGNYVYFWATYNDARYLARTDGTPEGTLLIHSSVSGTPGPIGAIGNTPICTAEFDSFGSELWRTDGTPGGTMMIADINEGGDGSYPNPLITVDGVLYFTADDGSHGEELWRTDGTSEGTLMVADINPGTGSSDIDSVVYSNGLIYFEADDGTFGEELWVSDGTGVGTSLLMDINFGSEDSRPYGMYVHQDAVFFTANDGLNGYELWVSQGTSDTTRMVGDINSEGDAVPGPFYALGNTIIFNAQNGSGNYLYSLEWLP